jgi:hypothetical protein
MSWNQYDLTRVVTTILRDAWEASPDHHFGPPYLTPYQLAIEIEHTTPAVFRGINKPLGGKGAGQTNTLGAYLANELSKLIKHGGIDFPIEGGHLSSRHVEALTFKTIEGHEIESTLPGSGIPFSLFRLRR